MKKNSFSMGMDVQTPLLRGYFGVFLGPFSERVVGILQRGIFGVVGLGRPVKGVSELGTPFIGEETKFYGTFCRELFFHNLMVKREKI
ncbi:MAG: hypothetical protein U9R60_12615 [Bacteroidota bacterium]|nr:hypothetical protein [Bacteroidota bacterium]